MSDPLEEKIMNELIAGKYREVGERLAGNLMVLHCDTEKTEEILRTKLFVKGADPVVPDDAVFACRELVRNNKLVIFRIVSQRLAEIIRMLRPSLRV